MDLEHVARARIARGWASSCLTQDDYAAQHGISARALRGWLAKYTAGRRPEARARAIIRAAIEDLQGLLAGLDAEEEGQGGSDGQTETFVPERRASAEPTPASLPSQSGLFFGFS